MDVFTEGLTLEELCEGCYDDPRIVVRRIKSLSFCVFSVLVLIII